MTIFTCFSIFQSKNSTIRDIKSIGLTLKLTYWNPTRRKLGKTHLDAVYLNINEINDLPKLGRNNIHISRNRDDDFPILEKSGKSLFLKNESKSGRLWLSEMRSHVGSQQVLTFLKEKYSMIICAWSFLDCIQHL